jgi:CHAT domain-containing protein/tetratricopeptide (TPR) repeat protein
MAGDILIRVVSRLHEISSADEFVELIASEPWLTSRETLAELELFSQAPEFAAFVARYRDLLRDAGSDPAAAWERFAELVEASQEAGARLEQTTRDLEDLTAREEWDEVIALSSAALPDAEANGLGGVVGFLRLQLGTALLRTRSGNRSENVERAGWLLDSAAALAPDAVGRGRSLMHLAFAHSTRVQGDPRENKERAYQSLKRVLEQVDLSQDPELVTTTHTNLGQLLQEREEGDRIANLKEAEAHCLEALKWRSPERDLGDWAFTTLNLAATRENLAGLGVSDFSAAQHGYEQVIAYADRVRPRLLAAHAHAGIARILAHQAEPTFDPAIPPHKLKLEPDFDLLAAALGHLESALTYIDEGDDRVLCGRVLNRYAQVLKTLERCEEALTVAQRAMAALPPTLSPPDSQTAAGLVAELLADAGEWEKASDAFRVALVAAELRFRRRIAVEDRRKELEQAGNLARWAAYAIARSGHPSEAVRVLEGGRARELRERGRTALVRQSQITVPTAIDGVDVAAAPSFTELDARADQSAAVEATMEEIRALDGLRDFDIAADPSDLAAAVEPGWPLMYINPAPAGLSLFVVTADEVSGFKVDTVLLEEPTSRDVILRVLFGYPAGSAPPVSYIGTAAGITAGRTLDQALDYVLPWIGEQLAAPIHQILVDVGARGATLIPSGPLGLAPLHAAPWSAGDGRVCLLDEFPIRYAPSAALHEISRQRAAAASDRPSRLLALGNPEGADLPASEAEVLEIAALFDPQAASTAVGARATSAFLRDHLADATHLHFACHGRGSPLGFGESAITLSDAELAAESVGELGHLATRLTVVSACQTAISDIELVSEVFSISTVLLAAGSACVIASLWPVDDFATALLMTRTYEELLSGDASRSPSEALREAQLWLRDLSEKDEQQYLSRHPELEHAFREREAAGRVPGRRRAAARGGDLERGPYSHPEYWAAFIAVGA